MARPNAERTPSRPLGSLDVEIIVKDVNGVRDACCQEEAEP